jgi:hypothetical protein
MFMDWQNQYCEMAILLKTSHRFNATLIKILKSFFPETEKPVTWKQRKPRIAKGLLSKKNNAGDIPTPHFKLWCRAT